MACIFVCNLCVTEAEDQPSITLQGKQGIVKVIYRGIIFLYDQNQEENGGYFCCKSRICEKIKLSIDTFNEKVGTPLPLLWKII